jgi:hypothetical protein
MAIDWMDDTGAATSVVLDTLSQSWQWLQVMVSEDILQRLS